jgi:quercetin dioxygenase-like cupin family protein
MTKTAENPNKATSRVSRRVVLQMAPVFASAVAAEGITSSPAYAQGGYEQVGTRMTQILRSDLQGQGNQVQESIVTQVDFPPGQGAPLHLHPGAQEILYVLEGNVTVELEGQRAKMINTGEIALTPADVPHSVRNNATSMAAKVLVIHSRADKQKPLLTVVKN